MIPVPSGVKIWLAAGYTDMRKGFPGLALMVQGTLKRERDEQPTAFGVDGIATALSVRTFALPASA